MSDDEMLSLEAEERPVVSKDMTNDEPQDEERPGPGEQLRLAREQAGRPLTEIAARLHLSSFVVEHLEQDDYEALPGATFVKGYLRAYAREVQLCPDGIVADFDRLEGSLPLAAPPPLRRTTPKKAAKANGDGLVRLVTYLIVVALAGLVWLWWSSQKESSELAPAPLTSPLAPSAEAEQPTRLDELPDEEAAIAAGELPAISAIEPAERPKHADSDESQAAALEQDTPIIVTTTPNSSAKHTSAHQQTASSKASASANLEQELVATEEASDSSLSPLVLPAAVVTATAMSASDEAVENDAGKPAETAANTQNQPSGQARARKATPQVQAASQQADQDNRGRRGSLSSHRHQSGSKKQKYRRFFKNFGLFRR